MYCIISYISYYNVCMYMYVCVHSLLCFSAVSPQGSVSITSMGSMTLGSDLTLLCSASGGPGNTFQWSHEGDLLMNATNDTLVFSGIVSTDQGVYTCKVNNSAGVGNATFTLAGMCIHITYVHKFLLPPTMYVCAYYVTYNNNHINSMHACIVHIRKQLYMPSRVQPHLTQVLSSLT